MVLSVRVPNPVRLRNSGYTVVAVLDLYAARFEVDGDCVKELDRGEGMIYLWCRGDFVIKGVVDGGDS